MKRKIYMQQISCECLSFLCKNNTDRHQIIKYLLVTSFTNKNEHVTSSTNKNPHTKVPWTKSVSRGKKISTKFSRRKLSMQQFSSECLSIPCKNNSDRKLEIKHSLATRFMNKN